MPRRSTLVLSGREVDRLAVAGRDRIFWDRELAGFGVRVYPSGRKVYVVQSRARGGPKRVTLGTHGELTATQARLRAGQVIDRIKGGGDPIPPPARAGATIADLAERYLSAHVAQNCNAHTAGIYRGSLENHILPALGMMPLAMVETAHVAALHYRLRETPRAANRALSVLSKMFSLAAAWGLVPDGANPCRGVRKYKEKKRERFLTRDEYRRLGMALAQAEAEAEAGVEGAVSPYAVAALRLLMLTGCRLNEILTLRWDDIDRTAGEFRLRDGKTGARMVPLTPTAERVLAGIARLPHNPWVIVGKKPGTHLATITADWYRLRSRAGLDDVRIHDLRHSYASRALAAGESLSMIGKLLGHADIQSTARYAHLARETERISAARVGGSIGADIGTVKEGPTS
ncbi:MAG: site-specific integrase [Rhodospirillales bacterium]|nr:site-specific integrase [Rhodospirillales bacterium]